MELMGASALDDLVYVRVIEVSLSGFKLLPVDGSFHGIGMQGSHRLPDLRQFGWPAAGIVNLAAQNQKGATLDQ